MSEIKEVTYQRLDLEPYLQYLQQPFASGIDGFIPETEQAAKLSISLPTLRRWRRQKYGPQAVQIGRKFYYRQDATERWLEKQASEAEAEREPPRHGRPRRVGR